MNGPAAVDRDWLFFSKPARQARDLAIRQRENLLGGGASALFLLLATSGLAPADRAWALALVAYAAGRIVVGLLRSRRLLRDHRSSWAKEARIASADLLRAARNLPDELRRRLDRMAMLAAVLADRLEDRTAAAGGLARALTTDLPILARAATLAASRPHDGEAASALAKAVGHLERMLDDATRQWDRAGRDELDALLAILARRAAEQGLG